MIPELATQAHIQPSGIGGMIAATKSYVNVDIGTELEYFDAGSYYRPTAILDGLNMTRVGWDFFE